jgi:hypothetical protein
MKIFLILSIIVIVCIHGTYSANRAAVEQQLKKATLRFLAAFANDTCAQMILNETVRQKYLSDKLTGRVQPVGAFPTTELALEYLFGLLCSIPNLPTRSQVATVAHLQQITYHSQQFLISFKIQIDLVSMKKLNFYGMLAFDSNYKLCGYEAVIQNLGLTLDFPAETQSAYIQRLCQGTQLICPVGSAVEQYASVDDCVTFLSAPNTPFGSYDRGDQNNVICRLIHIQLAQIAPALHCPHLGKTGGGACTDKTADTYFGDASNFVQCAHRYDN